MNLVGVGMVPLPMVGEKEKGVGRSKRGVRFMKRRKRPGIQLPGRKKRGNCPEIGLPWERRRRAAAIGQADYWQKKGNGV